MHTLTLRRYVVLGVVTLASAFGDTFLAIGMKSLIAPAAGSLTFVTNAVAARWVLHENVDRRRWLAALFVCCGVALLKH